jgi:hypothetical protein
MTMRTRRRLIVTAVVLGSLAVAGVLAAGPRLARRGRITIHPSDEITVAAHSPAPGLPAFSARGVVGSHLRDAVYWWNVQITRHTAEGLKPAWSREYDDMPFYTKARKGMRVPHALAEQRVNLPAGSYNVYIAVKEDVGEADIDGNIVATSMDVAGRSVVVEVK